MVDQQESASKYTDIEIKAHLALVSAVFVSTGIFGHILMAQTGHRNTFIHEQLFGTFQVAVLLATRKGYDWSKRGLALLFVTLCSSPIAFGAYWSKTYGWLFIVGMILAAGAPITNAIVMTKRKRAEASKTRGP